MLRPSGPSMPPRTDPAPVGALGALRAATRPAHDAIDGAFQGGLRTPQDYRRYLGALLPLARWLDAALCHDWPPHLCCWHDPGCVDSLQSDLEALGAAVPPPGRIPPAGPAQWMGGCYVIEGSALGARLLSRDVAAMPAVGAAGLPHGFLARLLGDPGRWPRFRTALGAMPGSARPALLDGAALGFALVAGALAMEGHPA